MKQNECIQKILEEKNIKNYKIVSISEKKLVFKYSFGEISTEETKFDKMNLFFSTKKGTSKIILLSTGTNDFIKKLIEDAIEKTNNNVFQTDVDFESSEIENKVYNEFNKNKYLKWLESEVRKVSQNNKINLSFLYTINLNEYNLLIGKNPVKQYHTSSECVCFEDQSFQKKLILNEVYLNDNLHEKILKNFHLKNPVFAVKDFDSCERVLIKAEAFAELLNIFVELFYANNVYAHGTVKSSDINKQIFKSSFDLVSLPYNGILFDSEGSKISEKFIIRNGRLLNLLSNNTYKRYLNINSSGNADLNEADKICCQRIKFVQKQEAKCPLNDADIIVKSFENIYLDFKERLFVGLAVCSDKFKSKYLTAINFGIEKIFDKIYCVGESKWIKNIYCSDVLVCLK